MQKFQTDTDKLIAYLQNRTSENGAKIKLTKPEESKLRMLLKCDELIYEYTVRQKVVPMLMNEFRIGYRTALDIFNQTQFIFGKSSPRTKNYWLDVVLSRMEENRQRCIDADDLKTLQKVDRDIAEIVGKYWTEEDMQDTQNIQRAPVLMSGDPNLVAHGDDPKVVAKAAQKIMQDFCEDAQDTSYEETK